MKKGESCKPFTPEHCRKISEAKKGKKLPAFSEEHRRKLSVALKGKQNFLGHTHSQETIAKMSKAKMGNPSFLGLHHSPETRARMRVAQNRPDVRARNSAAQLIAQNRPELKARKSASMTGVKSRFWQGGKSFEKYTRAWTRALKLRIRTRDSLRCQMCSAPQGRKCHDVHHIDYVKTHCADTNLITLCHKCHLKTNIRREYWTRYFQTLMLVEGLGSIPTLETQGELL